MLERVMRIENIEANKMNITIRNGELSLKKKDSVGLDSACIPVTDLALSETSGCVGRGMVLFANKDTRTKSCGFSSAIFNQYPRESSDSDLGIAGSIMTFDSCILARRYLDKAN
jgi:hypothetical protein